ncbi:hypothetical protein ACFQZ8_06945, partial [Micromonospora azadirachtae]
AQYGVMTVHYYWVGAVPAAGDAEALVEEAIEALSAALAAQKGNLGGWQEADSADTEELRMAVRRYRDFLDRVLGR